MSGESMNGYTLSGVVLPEEVLIHLMSFVDHQTLLSCRLVCHVWRELVDAHVWQCKLQREKQRHHSARAIDGNWDLPWFVYYSIFNKDPYGRNLIKNPCGEGGLKHWTVLRNHGNGIVVDKAVLDISEIPEGVGSASFFVSSYGDCIKEQWIDLTEAGIPPRIMDEVQPAIHVSDWYAKGPGRFTSVYQLQVSLCNGNRENLMMHTSLKKFTGGLSTSWTEKSHIFRKYPAGVRYINFRHRSKDKRLWAGLTGSSVKVTFLNNIIDSSTEPSDQDTSSGIDD